MPTTWNRSPEEFHKIYLANTDAFYRIGNAGLAKELDEFMTKCALSLWSRAGSINERHVEMANQIYSRSQPQPKWLLWSLTSSACAEDAFTARPNSSPNAPIASPPSATPRACARAATGSTRSTT